MAWCQEGHDSAITDNPGIQIVDEVYCEVCFSSTRRFEQHHMLQLHVPQTTLRDQVLALEDLLNSWQDDVCQLSCKFDGSRNTERRGPRGLCKLPQIMNIHIGRSRQGRSSSGQTGLLEEFPFVNRLSLKNVKKFDFKPWLYDGFIPKTSTVYELVMVIFFDARRHHYLMYYGLPKNDGSGEYEWVVFDDISARPERRQPDSGWNLVSLILRYVGSLHAD
jgi:hypothetical protein